MTGIVGLWHRRQPAIKRIYQNGDALSDVPQRECESETKRRALSHYAAMATTSNKQKEEAAWRPHPGRVGYCHPWTGRSVRNSKSMSGRTGRSHFFEDYSGAPSCLRYYSTTTRLATMQRSGLRYGSYMYMYSRIRCKGSILLEVKHRITLVVVVGADWSLVQHRKSAQNSTVSARHYRAY